jgi:hypothetical protein
MVFGQLRIGHEIRKQRDNRNCQLRQEKLFHSKYWKDGLQSTTNKLELTSRDRGFINNPEACPTSEINSRWVIVVLNDKISATHQL